MSSRERTVYDDPVVTDSITTVTGPGGSTVNSSSSCYEYRDRKYCLDVETPGWKKLVHSGQAICNDATIVHGICQAPSHSRYDGNDVYYGSTPASFTHVTHSKFNLMKFPQYCPYLTQYVGDVTYRGKSQELYVPKYPLDTVKQELLLSCYAKAGHADALLGVSAVEAKKSMESVNRLISLLPRFKTWVKGTFGPRGTIKLKNLSRDGARQWLEYRYGFMQLYYDMMSYKAVWDHVGKTGRTRFVSRRIQSNGTSYANTSLADDFASYPWGWSRTRKDEITAGVIINPRPAYLDRFQDLGLLAPVQSVWELIPYTWIVDWFVNTAEIFAAFDGLIIRDVFTHWTSHRSVLTGNYYLSFVGKDHFLNDYRYVGTFSPQTESANETVTEYIRSANPSLHPVPQFTVKMNWKRFSDLAALLRQILK